MLLRGFRVEGSRRIGHCAVLGSEVAELDEVVEIAEPESCMGQLGRVGLSVADSPEGDAKMSMILFAEWKRR
jgi:hypothetical protein